MIMVRMELPQGTLEFGRDYETMKVHIIVDTGDGTQAATKFVIDDKDWAQLVRML